MDSPLLSSLKQLIWEDSSSEHILYFLSLFPSASVNPSMNKMVCDATLMSEQPVVVIKDLQAGMKRETEKRSCVFLVPELEEDKGHESFECFLAVRVFLKCIHE